MIKLITDSDLDGNSCLIAAKIFFKDDIDVTKSTPKKVNQDVLEALENHSNYSKIFITDLSVNKEVADKLDSISDKVCLLDHHITADFLNQYSWANVQVELDGRKTCGAELFLNYVYNNMNENNIDKSHKIFDFIEITRKYDTWEWHDVYNDLIPKRMNDLMYLKGIDTFVEEMVLKINSGEDAFSQIDIALLDFKQKEIDRYIEDKEECIISKNILGYNAGVVFAENFKSELGNALSKRHPEFDFIAIIGGSSISYRTIKDDVDLSKVAKYFGGGGHSKASGSGIDSKILEKHLDSIFKTSLLDKFIKKEYFKK